MTPSLMPLLTRAKRAIIAVGLFSAGINLLVLTGTIYMMQVFDRVLTGQSGATLFYLSLLALFLLTIYGFLELVRSRILVRLGTWLETFLAPVVLSRGLESCVASEKSTDDGLQNLAKIRQFVSGPGLLALLDAPWVPIYLALSFLLHPLIGMITFGAAVVLFGLALLSHRITARDFDHAHQKSAQNSMLLRAAFSHAGVADGLGMLNAIVRRWYSANLDVLAIQEGAHDRMGLITASTKFFRNALQIIVLGTGAWLVLQHQMSAGSMTAASIILTRTLAPVEAGVAAWKTILSAHAAWLALGRLLERRKLREISLPIQQPRGLIKVEGLTQVLPGSERPLLHNLNFEAQPGEALAIIGPSGAGKSTLAKLIVGLSQPSRGHVRFDGADLFSWDRAEIGAHIGYLSQENEFFPGTIAENIARLSDTPEPEKVLEAARMAGVHDLILRLPQGYDTRLAHGGVNLSGGQRQRIALARAIYNRPRLLVLDEPDSHLDAQGDLALNEAIVQMKKAGCSIILVAHRPALMRHVDKVLVLHDGCQHLHGPRDVVLSRLQNPASPLARAS